MLFFPVILSLIGPPPFDLDRPPNLEDKAVTAEELEPQLTHREKSAIVGVLKEEVAIKKIIDMDCRL